MISKFIFLISIFFCLGLISEILILYFFRYSSKFIKKLDLFNFYQPLMMTLNYNVQSGEKKILKHLT
jgi:hypothetical protein